ARGKQTVVVCYTCHRIGANGFDFGPELTGFGKTQTREVLLRSLIDPSADISHGYDSSELVAKDGTIVHGIVIAQGDPVIIKSMAGMVQTVPRSKIRQVKKLKRSLMFSADMLGMNAQMLADIVAYLQSDL
ncbi:MAG: PVC-type heme-binding CxxCH protein, partial [Verrucomicrobiia bacterium]